MSTDATGKAAEASQLEGRLAQRIADAKQAEARLEQKLGQLAKSEQTLHGLLDSLRHAVSEACPLVGELRNYRETAKSTVNEVVQTAKAQFARVVTLVRGRMDLLKEAEARFAGTVEAWETSARQRLAGLGDELAAQVEPAVEAARARILDVADGLPMLLAEKLESFRAQADAALGLAEERVGRKVQEFETQSGVFEDWLEAEMKQAREALAGLLTQHETRAHHVASSLAQVIDRSTAKAAGLAGVVEKSIEAGVEEIKVRVAGRMHEVAAEAGALAEGKCVETRVAMAGALNEFDQTLRLNLAQIAQAGEGALLAAEERLAVRVRDLRPAVWRAVQEAESDALKRLAKVDQTLRAEVELSERELTDRLATLRPRAVAALKGMEADLARRAAELEAEGTAITAWLERRLAERASAAVDRARRVIHQETQDAPRNPVEVSVFVRGNSPTPTDDRAAHEAAA